MKDLQELRMVGNSTFYLLLAFLCFLFLTSPFAGSLLFPSIAFLPWKVYGCQFHPGQFLETWKWYLEIHIVHPSILPFFSGKFTSGLEISCNSKRISGPPWRLANLKSSGISQDKVGNPSTRSQGTATEVVDQIYGPL